MLHGEQLGTYTIVTANKNIRIVEARSAPNPNYLLVNLELSVGLAAGDVDFTLTSNHDASLQLVYSFKQRRAESKQRVGFSSEDVIYLVTPDRFANGDQSNDNVERLLEKADRSDPDGRHGGDLLGLTNGLDYLHGLGITQVWLNPLQENNQQAFSYHGYSITDLYNIDARCGGNQALLDFTERAKQLGIGLIRDTIPNHIGLNHWWMTDLSSSDWVNNQSQYRKTTHRHEMVQDPCAPESDKKAFTDGRFVPTISHFILC